MKVVSTLLISVFLMLAFWVFIRFDDGPFLSPTNEYTLTAKVDYVYYQVNLVIKDKDGEVIDDVDTEANDSQKWAAGWMNYGDTVVLYSSDIGPRAYSMLTGKLHEIEIYEDTLKSRSIFKRADQLYKVKYQKK